MNVEAEAKRHEADKAASKDLAMQKAALLQDKMQFLMLDAMTNTQKKDFDEVLRRIEKIDKLLVVFREVFDNRDLLLKQGDPNAKLVPAEGKKLKIPDDKTWKPFDLKEDVVLQNYFDRVELVASANEFKGKEVARMQLSKFANLEFARIYSQFERKQFSMKLILPRKR